MGKYRIAFFDIDGTLADNSLPRDWGIYERIPDSAKQALISLKEQGIEPVIASGRNHATILEFAKKLQISSIISSNGTHVSFKGRPIAQHCLPKELIYQVASQLQKHELDFLLETPHEIFEAEILNHKAVLPDNVVQLICHLNESSPKLNEPKLIVERVAPGVVNIHSANVSKATGINEILTQLNISPAEALAFGDEENDFEMFKAVGMPVAMGNALPELKQKAKHVTDSVENDGIWNACLELGLINK